MGARVFLKRRNLVDAIVRDLAPLAPCDDRRGRSAFVAVASLALLLPVYPAMAATYVVDTTGDPGPGGTTSLRQAVAAANGAADNFVEFAPALNGSTITLASGEIAINQPMTVVGPGADKLTVSGNDAARIFYISTPSTTPIAVTLAGLTLNHGHATSNNLGGAIFTSNVSLTLQDSALESNYALQGGAIFLYSGNGVASASKLVRTTVANNNTKPNAGIAGGILASGGATLQIVDSIISANTSSQDGGALLYNVGSTTIDNSQVTGNHTEIGGGGLDVFRASSSGGTFGVTITNSTISGNTTAGNGGGISVINVVATLTGDTIEANSAANYGGGIFVFDSTSPRATQLNLQQSSVSGNSANSFGGGIDVSSALSISIERSLIAFNNVYDFSGGGGGVALRYAKTSASIDNSTIYGNYAYNNGGGVGIFDAATGNVTTFSNTTIAGNLTFNYASNGILGAGTAHILNCVIANSSSHSSNQDVDGTFAESYSLIRNVGSAALTIAPGNKNGQEPLLGPLAVNGGPTLTLMPALSSPALDAGDPALANGSDQRGLPRVVNGRADMGAVERQYPEDVIFRNGFDSS
jgi:hypothetical protein